MTIDRKAVTIGSDAELPVFLADGTPYPVCGLVGGSKQNPKPLPKMGKGFAIQEDNVNFEFNIPPATDRDTFSRFIETMVELEIPKHLPPGMFVRAQSATQYKPEFLRTEQAQQFGCEPDYCVWTMEENPKPKCDDPTLRTASGHIHVGWPNPTMEDRVALVKALDFRLGLWNLGRDTPGRRQLYGKAGAHRPKEYGVEYRVLGNSWLIDRRARNVFDWVIQAIADVNDGISFSEEEGKIIQECINRDDIVPGYHELVDRVNAVTLAKQHERANAYAKAGAALMAGKKSAVDQYVVTQATNAQALFGGRIR